MKGFELVASLAAHATLVAAINAFLETGGIVQLNCCVTLENNTATIKGRGCPILTALRLDLISGHCIAWSTGENFTGREIDCGDWGGRGLQSLCDGESGEGKGCHLIMCNLEEEVVCRPLEYVVQPSGWIWGGLSAMPVEFFGQFSTSPWCEEEVRSCEKRATSYEDNVCARSPAAPVALV
jgi:hypothetical protein